MRKSWMTHVFDHPVSDSPWYWDADESEFDDASDLAWYRALIELIADPARLTAQFSDAQIAQGLTYLCCYSTQTVVGFRVAPLAERLAFAEVSVDLYTNLFDAACAPTLGHLSESGGPLNGPCYMWWDWFDPFLDGDGHWAAYPGAETFVDGCSEILKLPNAACQEGALHGLEHLHEFYPELVNPILREYIARPAVPRPELRAYASDTLEGRAFRVRPNVSDPFDL